MTIAVLTNYLKTQWHKVKYVCGKDIVVPIFGKCYQPLFTFCPQLFTSFPHAKKVSTRYLPQNSQSLILLLEVCDVAIQIRSRCQGGSVDVVLLACFSSISEELWVKDSNYLSFSRMTNMQWGSSIG